MILFFFGELGSGLGGEGLVVKVFGSSFFSSRIGGFCVGRTVEGIFREVREWFFFIVSWVLFWVGVVSFYIR